MADPSPEESIFYAAVQLEGSAARAAYLEAACGHSPQLRQQIDELLSAFDEGEFLESPATDFAATALLPPGGEKPGAVIGPYKLLEQIGEGGMGLVFMAEQTRPIRRRVALKVIKPGLDTRAVIARFEAERQALALMDHPNIARVYEAGATDSGRPYFVMELVRGKPITEYCCERNLPLRERLELFIEVCQAVQHAHQKGVIHRDLKPTNILVSQSDTAAVPKVIDFGVAKATIQPLTERTLFTHFTQIIGTPLYMSPEQADVGNQDVDTRSDVYSLGVVLYELLTGTTPFDADRLRSVSQDEMRRIIREEEPPKPSTRATTAAAAAVSTVAAKPQSSRPVETSALKGDLDWIVMKALEKDRRRRYESPSAMAADLQRYLDRQPVHARPPSYLDKLAKWSSRHVALVWSALAASLFLAASLGVAAALIAASRDQLDEQRQIAVTERNSADAERNLAVAERNKARQNEYYAEIVASQIEVEQQNIGGVRARLRGHLPLGSGPDNRGWEWYCLMSRCHPELRTLRDEKRFTFATWSPDGRVIGGPGMVWDDRTAACLINIDPSYILRMRVAWSPDGQTLAWGAAEDDNGIYLWNRATNAVERIATTGAERPAGRDKSIWCLDWSPDGSQLASGATDHMIRIWDVATRSVIRTIPSTANVMHVAWQPDGKVLAAAAGNSVRTYNPQTGEVLAEIESAEYNWCLDWSPDGSRLFVANDTGWQSLAPDDFSTQRKHPVSRGGKAISCSPDGTKLAATHGESATVWDLTSDRPVAELLGHVSQVISVAWSPDGARLITSSDDGEIKIWALAQASSPAAPHFHTPISSVQWDQNDEMLHATSQSEGMEFVWKPGASEPAKRELPQVEDAICHSPDRTLVALTRSDGSSPTIDIVDVATKETRSVLSLRKEHKLWRTSCAFSGEGSRLAVVTESGNQMFLTCWDIDQERSISAWQWERLPHYARANQLTWSPNGKLIAFVTTGDIGDNGTSYWADHLNVIDVATGQRIFKRRPAGQRSPSIKALNWDASSDRVALGTEEGRVEVVEISSKRLVFSQKIHADMIDSLAWQPDSSRLASSGMDGTVKIITTSSGQPLLTFEMAERSGSKLAWSGDGRRLVAVSSGGAVQTWDASPAYEIAGGGNRRGELAWAYFDRARASSGEEARLALREALRHAPDALDYWSLRGSIHAILGEFDQAAEEFAKLAPSDFRRSFVAGLDLARCLMSAGRNTEYQRVCSSLASAFSDDEIRSNREYVIERCVASPTSSVDPTLLLRMARDPRGDEDPLPVRPINFYIGACLLRQGNYNEAARLMSECIDRAPTGPDEAGHGNLAYMKYFLSLARGGLGHDAQARRLLAEADEHASQAGDLQWNWRLRVDLDALRKEAEEALEP